MYNGSKLIIVHIIAINSLSPRGYYCISCPHSSHTLTTFARNLLCLGRLTVLGTRVIQRILTTLSTVVGRVVSVSALVVDGIRGVGTNTLKTGAVLLLCTVQLLAGLSRSGLAQAGVDVGRGSSSESCGGGDGALIARGLSWDLGLGVRLEGVLRRGGAGRVHLSMELGKSFVTNKDSGSVLDEL